MTVLILSTAAAWAMTGLIWMVQLVHYPLLARWSEAVPSAVAVEHQRRVTWVVGPLLAAEAATALVLLVERPDGVGAPVAWVAAALLGVALTSTALVQVPLHAALARGHDTDAAHRLVTTNWVRTLAWTGRAVVLTLALAAGV